MFIPIPELTKVDIARVWSKIEVGQLSACWIWRNKCVGKGGYGRITLNRKMFIVTRVIYFLYYGVQPFQKYVCHHCDTPSCCNPNHFFLGSAMDNSTDCKFKGRTLSGDKNPMRKYPHLIKRGELLTWSKVTEDDVREIRRLRKTKVQLRILSDRFGVSMATISNIAVGKTWAHVK